MFFTTVQCLTANRHPESLCVLSLTVIRNGRLYQEKNWLFCPPEAYLKEGVTCDAVSLNQLLEQPTFFECWEEIRPYFEAQLILFHQLPPTINALSKTLAYYGLSVPHFTFGSTMMLAKRLYPQLPNCKLETICKALKLTSHPQGLSSATRQMADMVLSCIKQFNCLDEEMLFTKAGICLGSYQSDGICYPEFLSHYCAPTKPTALQDTDPLETSSLRNEIIAFTGSLESMTRSMAVKRLHTIGAHFQSQVTDKTTLVVTNLYDPKTGDYKKMTTKLQKALILKGQGQKLTIIDEATFLERLALS